MMTSLLKAVDVNFTRPETTQHNTEEEEKFQKAKASINPKMGIAALLSNPVSEMVQTKFGSSDVGSTDSYQLSYTEANFRVNIDISSVPRLPN